MVRRKTPSGRLLVLVVGAAVLVAPAARGDDEATPGLPVNVPVVIIKYFPVKGDRIDEKVAGDCAGHLEEMRRKTTVMTREIITALGKRPDPQDREARLRLGTLPSQRREGLQLGQHAVLENRHRGLETRRHRREAADELRPVGREQPQVVRVLDAEHPGAHNGLTHRGKTLANWWVFLGDLDVAMRRGVNLDRS